MTLGDIEVALGWHWGDIGVTLRWHWDDIESIVHLKGLRQHGNILHPRLLKIEMHTLRLAYNRVSFVVLCAKHVWRIYFCMQDGTMKATAVLQHFSN